MSANRYQYPRPLPKRRPGSGAARIENALLEEINDLRCSGNMPTTGRFLYYRLVAREIVDKKKSTGAKDVSVVLTQLREAGVVAMDEIIDRSRGVVDHTGYENLALAAEESVRHARLDCWAGVPPLLVVESGSLAGLLEQLAYEYRVVLVPLGGQASCGFLGRELPGFVADGSHVLYLGDFDFSGGHIEQSAHARIEAYTGASNLNWERVALTEEQVKAYALPVIDKYDGRTKRHHPAVETEALDQRVLVPLVRASLDELEPIDVAEREQHERQALLARLAS